MSPLSPSPSPLPTPGARPTVAPLAWVLLLALGLAGCFERNEGPPIEAVPDAEVDAELVEPEPAVDMFRPEPDMAIDMAPETCDADDDCAGRGWCDADGQCQPPADERAIGWMADGVTRVGAARFELTPSAFEPWFDQASPDCPENRPGVFDGRLDVPEPEDPCADGFTDADGDGWFDAFWLGGRGLDRPAWGIAELRPPQGRVVLLTRDDQLYVLITLDVFALDAARLAALTDRLSRRLGIDPGLMAVHATGTRTGPDGVGLWGASLATMATPEADALWADAESLALMADLPAMASVEGAWWDGLAPRVAAAVRQAAADLSPVQVRSATARLPIAERASADGPIVVPDVDGDGLVNDADDLSAWRAQPGTLARDDYLGSVVDRSVHIITLDAADDGQPRVALVSWSAAPAATPIEDARLDADYPGAVRAALEARWPDAVAVWLTGAAADTLRAGDGAMIPEVDAEGGFIGPEGGKVDSIEEAAAAVDPAEALGVLIATRLGEAIEAVEPKDARLAVDQRYAWVPIGNPRLGLAARLGLLGPLRDWLRGAEPTDRWVGPESTPACGGLGCLRYRLDHVQLGADVQLLTVPGALDRAFVDGRLEARLELGDGRNLDDLDLDGRLDRDDDEIRLQARSGDAELVVRLAGPANPQRFPAIDGLGRTGAWIVGRTNGGLGSLRTAEEHINVFEGQLDPLAAHASDPEVAETRVCGAPYPCGGSLTLGELTERVRDAGPEQLADLPSSREMRLEMPAPAAGLGGPWRIVDLDGAVRAEGDQLELGPRDRAFTPTVDLIAAAVGPGDVLEIDSEPPARLLIAEVVPITLRHHPNAGDSWRALTPTGGDIVYNAACHLLYGGQCPDPRPVADDPNHGLPRSP